MGAAALLGGGIMGGGLIGTAGQLWANTQQMNFARDQQNWQQEMSSTAHQREVEDLKRAGLNPMLSVMNKGASTPGAISTPSLGNPGKDVGNAVGQAAQGLAIDMGKLANETALAKGQTAVQAAQARNLDAKTILDQLEAGRGDYITELARQKITSEILGQQATAAGIGETAAKTAESQARLPMIGAQTTDLLARAHLNDQEAKVLEGITPFIKMGSDALKDLMNWVNKGGSWSDLRKDVQDAIERIANGLQKPNDQIRELIRSGWQKVFGNLPSLQESKIDWSR